jgi:hypothetical protein
MSAAVPIASVRFVDGVTRPVYEESGRQYVYDEEGERVYGVWFLSPEEGDEPVIVEPEKG